MHKRIIIVLAVLSLLGSTGQAFSQEEVYPPDPKDFSDYIPPGGVDPQMQDNLDVIRGRVVSIDQDASQVVIEEDETQAQRTINIPAARLQYISIGDHVRVTIKPGENTAEDIRRLGSWHPSASRHQ